MMKDLQAQIEGILKNRCVDDYSRVRIADLAEEIVKLMELNMNVNSEDLYKEWRKARADEEMNFEDAVNWMTKKLTEQKMVTPPISEKWEERFDDHIFYLKLSKLYTESIKSFIRQLLQDRTASIVGEVEKNYIIHEVHGEGGRTVNGETLYWAKVRKAKIN
jgi:hypothetical protein